MPDGVLGLLASLARRLSGLFRTRGRQRPLTEREPPVATIITDER